MNLMQQAIELHKQGDLDGAAQLYQSLLLSEPTRFDAQHMLGVVYLQQGRLAEAISLMSSAAKIAVESADIHYDLGYALLAANRLHEAIDQYSKVLSLRPNDADALYFRAAAALRAGQAKEAIRDLQHALLERPQFENALTTLASALTAECRIEEAIACYNGAIELNPRNADAFNGRGNALASLDRYPEAVASYNQVIQLRPDSAEALCNRGNALFRLNRYDDSLADFKRARELRPDYVEALFGVGNAARALGRREEAFAHFSKALSLEPSRKYLAGDAAHAAAQIADWPSQESIWQQLRKGISEERLICFPFVLLGLTSNPELQLASARTYSQTNYPHRATPGFSPRRHRKIRLAYLSADFRDHATATLITELLEIHDRSRFTVVGISLAPVAISEKHQRIRSACDHFIDVSDMADNRVAALMRDMEIDIAVDLMGHTEHARTEIMALRAAPVQVNFLGYPGTMGAHFIDYIIADTVVIPMGSERYYTEKVVRLPNSYQVNDSKREIANRTPSRSDLGLPDRTFVFCCFNGVFKINPAMFDVWMRLLHRIERSVLWLLGAGATVENNLRMEADSRGIDASRLIFAPLTNFQEHLARHRAADLFLDTVPCNAHTGTSDALWAGLPVLTCTGESFASRVAASLLSAINMPELVTSDITDYEARAIELATNASLLGDLRRKLARNRLHAPLFNTRRFRQNIETAYLRMWDVHRRGEPPKSFSVLERELLAQSAAPNSPL